MSILTDSVELEIKKKDKNNKHRNNMDAHVIMTSLVDV